MLGQNLSPERYFLADVPTSGQILGPYITFPEGVPKLGRSISPR